MSHQTEFTPPLKNVGGVNFRLTAKSSCNPLRVKNATLGRPELCVCVCNEWGWLLHRNILGELTSGAIA